MIEILKITPITFHGVDCDEYLLSDDKIEDCTCCDLCVYNPYELGVSVGFAPCHEVHGCTRDSRCYFQILPI